jgi:hypothetical protein
MTEMSNTGIIRANSKNLQNNIQHMYDYAWKMVKYNIPITHIVQVTSKLQLV